MDMAVGIPPRRFRIRLLINLVIFKLVTVFVVPLRVTFEDGSLVSGMGDPLRVIYQTSALQIFDPGSPV